MKSYDEIAGRVLKRRDEYERKRKKRRRTLLTLAPIAASLCVVIAVALLTRLSPPAGSSPHNTDPHATDNEGRLLWADDRIYAGTTTLSPERAYVLPWEYRTDAERFLSFDFGGVTYTTRASEISASLVGEKLGDVTARGYDEYADCVKTATVSVYAVSGIDPAYLVAAKYGDADAYYVFREDGSGEAPVTLGALLDRYALESTLPFFAAYDYESRLDDDPDSFAVSDTKRAAIYAVLARYRDAAAVEDGYSHVARDERVSLPATSEVLGITNKAFTIGADGYLTTNLAEYGYAYFIGEDAAAEILSIVRTDAVPYENDAKERYYLTGTITAVGDGYIEVDDSILMKNPDDGIVFTVHLTDFRVRRLVECGYLKVGETVRVEYDGKIYQDAPTVVESALGIEKVVVSTNGDVLIPE